jgi:hypothetical protein
MADTGAQDRDRQAREYLRVLRSLSGELERAILAISCNALTDLEESIAEQETLTARLGVLQRELSIRNNNHAAILKPVLDRELVNEVLVACGVLQRLNKVYEAVLQHSSHSASLMASLLDSFKGHFQEASGPRLKYQTWSCQM